MNVNNTAEKQYNKQKKDNVLLIEKGKRGFWKVVFGRTMIMAVFCLAQILAFFLLSAYVTRFFPAYTVLGFHAGLALILSLFIINKPGNPSYKISWLVLILAFPVFGILMYFFTRMQLGNRIIRAKLREILDKTKGYLNQNEIANAGLKKKDPACGGLSDYLYKSSCLPTYSNNSVKYFPLGEDKFAELVRQLKTAKKYIFMEYFIVEEGLMWGTILKILEDKVKEGVEVRFMYDGMNAMARVPYNYYKKIRALGIQCKVFSPIHPVLSTHYNNRDHRKICVIDGKTAFTGGINLADEYINKKEMFGHWKDVGVMLQGSAVKSFTLMFLQMWDVGGEEETDYQKYLIPGDYLPEEMAAMNRETGYVIPYDDIPLDDEDVAQNVYLKIINDARQYVHIMTPYLVLDYETKDALKFAAERGVDVAIILPHIPDKKYAFALAKSNYAELIKSGVKIYEYTPGFVHAKLMVSDNRKAAVGSVNLDYRSFYLHYECGLFMYDVGEVGKIEEDFLLTKSKSQLETIEDVKNRSLFMKVSGFLMKVMAPLI
jgi:Phosphatidylserine/phosphatidylglycerophosphate/cardiolipin synthases and related enzymes